MNHKEIGWIILSKKNKPVSGSFRELRNSCISDFVGDLFTWEKLKNEVWKCVKVERTIKILD